MTDDRRPLTGSSRSPPARPIGGGGGGVGEREWAVPAPLPGAAGGGGGGGGEGTRERRASHEAAQSPATRVFGNAPLAAPEDDDCDDEHTQSPLAALNHNHGNHNHRTQPPTAADDDLNMSFPRVPQHLRLNVVFDELQVTSKSIFSKETKTLLHKVSGQFRAGELVAVMGPSGAGKTTLLNSISKFSTGMVSGGELSLTRHDGSLAKAGRAVCYLTQDDHVQPLCTAREAVMFAANLKVGGGLSGKARGLLVDDVLETLGLSGCSHTRASQLSGGQRKRLAIACELIDNPRVIFLDEPTTGLDTSTAMQCTQLMRRIARSGRAVICTIHQPSENMLGFFDQIYLLANGHCVYRGPPGNMLPFLSSLGFQCPQYHNPADFILEVANNEYGDAVPLMMEAVKHCEYPPPLPEIKEGDANGKVNGNSRVHEIETLMSGESNQPPSEWKRFRVLVTHNLLLQQRDWFNTNMRIFASLATALTIGLMFGPVGDNAERIVSNISVFFILALYNCYTPEAPAVMKYPDEIQVVKREWYNNWYSLFTYTLALLISSLPMHVMTSTIICSITYYMTGQLREPLRFAYMALTLILTSIAGESVGLQFGSLFLKKKILSLFIASVHLAYQILFSGFLALKPEMSQWFSYAAVFNHMQYSLNTIVLATYKGRGRVTCPEDVVYCHLRDSDSVLALFGLDNSEIWQNFLCLVAFIVIVRITGFISLNYNVKRVNL